MYARVKRYSIVFAISAVVLWGVVPNRLPSLHSFRPVHEAEAQLGGGGGGAMSIVMMIMMLMMMMSLMKNNNLQGKQAQRLNDAAPRLLNDPYGANPGGGIPGAPGAVPANPLAPNVNNPIVQPQQPGININIPLN